MGRRSVAEAIRPIRERAVASSSSAERAITQEMVAEACDTLGRGTQPPHPCGPRVTGFRQRASQQGRERPESWQNLPSRNGSRHRRPDPRETGPRGKPSGSRSQPCSAQAQSSDRSSHRPCAPTFPRLSHQRVMQATSQARRKIHPTLGRDLPRTWKGTPKRRSSIKRRLEGRNHRLCITDWTFLPSRRSVTCLQEPAPQFISRGRQSGWSEPPPSGDGRRPRRWRSSWEDAAASITAAGVAC